MTLFEACELGYECGLNTLEEAYNNVTFHAMSLFSYDKIDAELQELDEAYSKESPRTKIIDYLAKGTDYEEIHNQ